MGFMVYFKPADKQKRGKLLAHTYPVHTILLRYSFIGQYLLIWTYFSG
jgi:hypothetical protein